MTTLHSFLTPVCGTAEQALKTALEAELTTFLRAQHCNRHRIALAVAFIESHGTATGCPNLEDDEAAEANVILCNRLGDVESDPSTWPACFDEWVYEPTPDDEDFSGMVPAFKTIDEWDAIRPATPYEPTTAERLYVASEGRVDLFATTR